MASKQNSKEYPVRILREELRQRSVREAEMLSRSVSRLTSYYIQPCPEYWDEVDSQYAVAERLLYIQHCRSSLEQCIASGASCLRYRWHDGRVTYTRFRRTSPARIKVSGLLSGAPEALPDREARQ